MEESDELEINYEQSAPKTKYGLSRNYYKKLRLADRWDNRCANINRYISKSRKIIDKFTRNLKRK